MRTKLHFFEDIACKLHETKIVYYFYLINFCLLKSAIPNLFTLLNLFSGSVATIFAVNGKLEWAAWAVFLGIFFDFFDGFFARRLKVESELGLQLDSLADMVTSGLVPGIVMYKLIKMSDISDWISGSWIPYLGLIVTLASAYRLAKFNVSSDQKSYFIGLPTPANALLILSFPLIISHQNNDTINSIILNPYFLIPLVAISSVLLNAPIKLIALKFKTWDIGSNITTYILLILGVVFLIVFKVAAIPIIILTYILLSLLNPPL